MLDADPQFSKSGGMKSVEFKLFDYLPFIVSGRSLVYGLQAIGGSNFNNNSDLKKNVEQLVSDVNANADGNKWEQLHVNALKSISTSDAEAAIRQWEEILVEFPSDILSLHLAGLTCLMSGRLGECATTLCFFLLINLSYRTERIGDISGRILPSFRDEYTLSTVHAWHSFGLSETNLYTQAERHARIGLSLEPKNGWATHSLAHVFEMTSRYDDGISYMRQCESAWNFSNQIAGHNYWHWALYYLTKGDFDAAVDVLEQKLFHRAGFDSLSLSYLLSMEDAAVYNSDVSKHYDRIGDIIELHMNHHRSFMDAHVMMGLCVSKKYDEAEQFMRESIATEDLHGKSVNENLLRSILSYSREKYEKCVELLWPIRYNIKRIGGSDAQRDVFNLMLINACLRSNKLEQKLLAGQLIEEREMHRSKSPLTERLRKLL